MSRVEAAAQELIMALMRDPQTGINANLGPIEQRDGIGPLARVDDEAFFNTQASSEMIDSNDDAPNYPHVLVFISSDDNSSMESFAYFSGMMRVAMDIRISCDGFPQFLSLELDLYRYIEAARTTLQAAANLGEGIVYCGTHRLTISPVKVGGANFIQGARFDIDTNGFVPNP